MRVEYVWADCNYQNGVWGGHSEDAYFLTCTEEEVQKHIIPVFDRFNKQLSPVDESKNICFLVGGEGGFIDLHAAHYPISHMWNGDSPFVFVNPVINIDSLDTLKDFQQRLPYTTKKIICKRVDANIGIFKGIMEEYRCDPKMVNDCRLAIIDLERTKKRFQ